MSSDSPQRPHPGGQQAMFSTETKDTDKAPITKVAVIPAGGALSIVLLWLSELLQIPMSTEVAIAISTLVTAVVSYLVPERKA